MVQAAVTQTQQRAIIGKFRAASDKLPGVYYEHTRYRKTKAYPVEGNRHSLIIAGVTVASLNTVRGDGVAQWTANLKNLLRAN